MINMERAATCTAVCCSHQSARARAIRAPVSSGMSARAYSRATRLSPDSNSPSTRGKPRLSPGVQSPQSRLHSSRGSLRKLPSRTEGAALPARETRTSVAPRHAICTGSRPHASLAFTSVPSASLAWSRGSFCVAPTWRDLSCAIRLSTGGLAPNCTLGALGCICAAAAHTRVSSAKSIARERSALLVALGF